MGSRSTLLGVHSAAATFRWGGVVAAAATTNRGRRALRHGCFKRAFGDIQVEVLVHRLAGGEQVPDEQACSVTMQVGRL